MVKLSEIAVSQEVVTAQSARHNLGEALVSLIEKVTINPTPLKFDVGSEIVDQFDLSRDIASALSDTKSNLPKNLTLERDGYAIFFLTSVLVHSINIVLHAMNSENPEFEKPEYKSKLKLILGNILFITNALGNNQASRATSGLSQYVEKSYSHLVRRLENSDFNGNALTNDIIVFLSNYFGNIKFCKCFEEVFSNNYRSDLTKDKSGKISRFLRNIRDHSTRLDNRSIELSQQDISDFNTMKEVVKMVSAVNRNRASKRRQEEQLTVRPQSSLTSEQLDAAVKFIEGEEDKPKAKSKKHKKKKSGTTISDKTQSDLVDAVSEAVVESQTTDLEKTSEDQTLKLSFTPASPLQSFSKQAVDEQLPKTNMIPKFAKPKSLSSPLHEKLAAKAPQEESQDDSQLIIEKQLLEIKLLKEEVERLKRELETNRQDELDNNLAHNMQRLEKVQNLQGAIQRLLAENEMLMQHNNQLAWTNQWQNYSAWEAYQTFGSEIESLSQENQQLAIDNKVTLSGALSGAQEFFLSYTQQIEELRQENDKLSKENTQLKQDLQAPSRSVSPSTIGALEKNTIGSVGIQK